MSQKSKNLLNQKIEAKVLNVFISSIKNNRTEHDLTGFFNDLLSPPEQIMLSKRVAIAFMLLENKYTYEDIGKTLKVSRGTIAKIHSVLEIQGNGFKKTLGKMVLKKEITNTLKEFLDFLRPRKYTSRGDEYNKPSFDLKRELNQPL